MVDASDAGAASGAPDEVICSNCHKALPRASKFCGFCGAPLSAAIPAASAIPVADKIGRLSQSLKPVVIPPVSPVPPPPAGPLPRAAMPSPAAPAVSEPKTAPLRDGNADATMIFRGLRMRQIQASVTEMKPDGSEGNTLTISQETTIGRENCTLVYPEDAVLSPRHASLIIRNGRMFLKDLESQSGTFVRHRQDTELRPGDVFLLGRNLFRFTTQPLDGNPSSPESTVVMKAAPSLQHGPVTARLEHIQLNGEIIEDFGLEKPETTLGRTRGELVFSEDPYMSATHARVVAQPGRFILQDLKSKNGIYLKIRSEVELNDGDQFFLGEQLFRVAITVINP